MSINRVGQLKSIISGEQITDSYKGKDSISFQPKAKHIFGLNELPAVTDKTYGFYRRFIIVKFPRSFSESERDTRLTEKLLAEKDGIFNWCLQGLQQLLAQNAFTEGPAARKILEEYRMQNNPVACFVHKHIVIDAAGEADKDAVYQLYMRWCGNNGIRQPQPTSTFFRDLYAEIPNAKSTRRVNQGTTTNIITGIKLIGNDSF